ncbi:MAG TPA: glycosyltransferase family 1 protein [Pseudomonas sp.]|nr:glycosyltransferase family 1 protein [Pseudomonas sp.]
MQVIVNVQPLLTPLTGIGHYTRELTLQMLQWDEASQPVKVHGLTGTFCEPLHDQHALLQTADCGSHANAADAAKGGGAAWRFARRYLRNPLTRRAYRWLAAQRLQRHTRRLAECGDSLYWEPNYILLPWKGPSVVTVHDLSHERHPDFHPGERVDFFNRHLAQSLQRASRINVVSRFTANELQELHDVDAARIDIVPPGVAQRFFQAPGVAQVAQLRQRHSLPTRFLLSVGTLEPRKNLQNVMQAFAELPASDQRAAPLLLAGMQGWGQQRLSREVEAAMQAGTIRRLGYIPDADLPALYALAAGFVYVSRYEGFGMPVIEAMAAGTPVLTANVTATAEVGEGVALLVPPDDIEAIRQGMQRLLDDDHTVRAAQGRQRAARFGWPDASRKLRASFQQALEVR